MSVLELAAPLGFRWAARQKSARDPHRGPRGALEDGRWPVETADGSARRADFLITACGFLHHPVLPDIPGLDRFAGPCFHSAR